MLSKQLIDDFISRNQLPVKFLRLIEEHYNPLASWLIQKKLKKQPLLLGINGAQGTGKSTLADFLRISLEASESWHVAILSIDNFYLTREERKHLSETVHPLLITRGVPGTHDLKFLSACIEQLRTLAAGSKLTLPIFNKAQDDRAPVECWPAVTGPIDLIILEGWCVGSVPQAPEILKQPVNSLERDRDPTGQWRQFVNEQLEESYANLFSELDFLLFLQAPNFEVIFRWRLEQEEKLAAQYSGNNSGIMNHVQTANFIHYFERLTRANFKSIPKIADIILQLDDHHDCVRSLYLSKHQ